MKTNFPQPKNNALIHQYTFRLIKGRPLNDYFLEHFDTKDLNLYEMSEKEELSEGKDLENQSGVILGFWDHERTPTLIQELEYSINSVERKCKNLLEELIYYKKYLQESEEPEVSLAVIKKKNKKQRNSHFFSGSDPDIAFRKNLISLQETQQIFEEKFQEKLLNIHGELGAAARKLGLSDSIILFPMDDYLRALSEQTEQKARKSWSDVKDKFIKLACFKAKTKSDSVIADCTCNDQIAKITKNELKLYQNLSKLSLKHGRKVKPKQRKMISSKARKPKYCCRKKTPRFVLDPKPDHKTSEARRSKSRRPKKRAASPPEAKRRTPCCPANPRSAPKEPAIHDVCKSLTEAMGSKRSREAVAEEKVPLGTAVRKAVPFTACTSTTRSYNIGLNIQELLSLTKRKGKSKAPLCEQSPEGGREQGARRCREVAVKAGEEKRRAVSWVPGSKSEGFESAVSQLGGGKVWVSKEGTSNFRKVRSKYTGSSSGGFMEYHRSTMSQYTNGQKSMFKSESKSAYAVGSKIMVSGCERTDVFEIDKGEHLLEKASGDGNCIEKCAKLSREWTKVYGSFLSTYRKYTSLKEKLSDKNLAPSNDELKSLENEIDHAIEKYKDFLHFYSKFLHLKHRLKSLKIACETKMIGPVTSFSSNCQRKVNVFRPTYSMAMKKALQEVQALQDRIRLVSD